MQTQNTPPNNSPPQTPQPLQGNNLGQLFISVLQESVRQQPIKPVQSSTWLDERFGLPANGEDLLWRVSWLIGIPGVVSLIVIPIGQWLWLNGLPMVVILASAAFFLLYWGLWMVATSTPTQTPRNLIRLQLSVPVLMVWFVMIWRAING